LPGYLEADMTRYLIRERLFRLAEDSDITDETGKLVLRVNGQLFRDRVTLRDPSGAEVAQVRHKMVSFRPTYRVIIGGEEAAEVRKRFFTPFGDRFVIDVPGPDDLEMEGNLLNHEFVVRRGGTVVATVSKAMFSFRDTYAVEVAPGQNDLLVLASVLALDLAQDRDKG
jgi:uncharacterized protein YxjI